MRTRVRKTAMLVLAVSGMLGCQAQARPKDFGKQWVRSHPFTTMGLSLVEKAFDGKTYKDGNFSLSLVWKPRKGIFEHTEDSGLPWHFNVRRPQDGPTDELKERLRKLHDTYRGCQGWLVWDEPKRPEMFTAAPTLQWLREEYPETLVYSNAYPKGVELDRAYGGEAPPGWSYQDYLQCFIDIMQVDVLMFDLYPFKEDGGTSNFFPCLEDTRQVALQANIPYWAFIQSYADERRKSRMPSESDVRMQAFAHLTYGFTGIAYFTYDDAQGPGIVDMSGKPRPIYYDVQRLNNEIGNIGQALRFLTSSDVRFVAANGNKTPAGPAAWRPEAGGGLIRAIEVQDKKAADWKNLLIGYFRDDADRPYVMITNLWHDAETSAAKRKVAVRIVFDQSVESVARLSRETGAVEQLALEGHTLTLTLPGGTGDLLRLNGVEFAGM